MIPDDYTTAARAEAETRWPSYPTVGFSGADDRQATFREGAEWARVYLTQQEPTEDEVEAAARALNVAGWTCYEGMHEPGHYEECLSCRDVTRPVARAALRAARDVRGQA